MTRLFLKYLSIIFSLCIVAALFDTVYIKNTYAVLIMGLVLLIVNLIIKPVLLIIALPFTVLTFGLFSFVVNALTIMLADCFVAGVNIGGFLNALLAALLISFLNSLLQDRKKQH